MPKFSMTCQCGDTMTMDAKNRNEAVTKFKAMMTPDAIAAHMADKHPGKPVMETAQVHASIEQQVQAVQ